MGTQSSKPYSIIKESTGCCSYSKANDLKDVIIISDNFKQQQAVLIQSFYRGYLIRSKYQCHPFDYSKLCQEVAFSYPTDKFDNHPNIIKLRALIEKYELTEKEKFIIQSSLCKNIALLYFDGSLYKGYINSKWQRETFGILYQPDGSIYEGFFEGNRIEGRGRLYTTEGSLYDGEFVNSCFNGFGKSMSLSGDSYRGNWRDNKHHGYGDEIYIDGSSYSGYFVNGKKNGKGKFRWKNSNKYEGSFINDEITGFGVYKWKDRKVYCGNWINHKMNGNGVFLWPDQKKYIGYYLENQKQGFGIFYSPDGRRFEGEWKEGMQYGNGKLMTSNNKVTYVEYFEGKKIKTITNEQEIQRIEKELLELRKKYNYEIFESKIQECENIIANLLKEDLLKESNNLSEAETQSNTPLLTK